MKRLIALLSTFAFATPAFAGNTSTRVKTADVVDGLAVEQNYVALGDAERGVGSCTTYANTAAATPVDMAGGLPNSTCTRTTTGGEILNGIASFLLTINAGATRQGEGFTWTANLPVDARGLNKSFRFKFQVNSGSLVQGDLVLYAYDATNNEALSPIEGSVSLLGTKGIAEAVFPTRTNTAQLRVGVHIARASGTGALSISADRVQVSEVQVVKGLAGSNTLIDNSIVSFSAGFGSVSGQSLTTRRVGDRLEVSGYVTAGTVAGTAATMTLKAGVTADYSKLGTATNAVTIGKYIHIRNAAADPINANNHEGVLYLDGTSASTIYFAFQSGPSAGYTTANVSSIILTGSRVYIEFSIPVSGYDSNVSMAESSSFRISSYLANGTRVTGTAPTRLGEYRSYLRNASAVTYTETNGAPSTTPSVTDGIWLRTSGTYASADASANPSRYEIFVGRNKNVRLEVFGSTGRSSFINSTPYTTTSTDVGIASFYDPSTGIIVVKAAVIGNTNNVLGYADAGTNITTAYFDVIVSENANHVGVQTPRSELFAHTYVGYGATDTKVMQFSTATTLGTAISRRSNATEGDVFTIHEDGVYAISFLAISASAGSSNLAITRNASLAQRTSNPDFAASGWTSRVGYARAPPVTGTTGTANVPAILNLRAGDQIRAQTDGFVPALAGECAIRITKVSP